LADALPGSASATAAGAYAQSWPSTFGRWCDQAGQSAANLTQAADNYQATEQANADRLDPNAGKLRGPR
jgi:hypothetical protein